jgi:hypothetical protein
MSFRQRTHLASALRQSDTEYEASGGKEPTTHPQHKHRDISRKYGKRFRQRSQHNISHFMNLDNDNNVVLEEATRFVCDHSASRGVRSTQPGAEQRSDVQGSNVSTMFG